MAEERKFKVGDTVRLNSGGPLMTVNSIVPMADGSYEIATVWFDGKDEKHSRFKPSTISADDGAPIIG